jgi:hypothetical protein
MDDGHYRREAYKQGNGFQLVAMALGEPVLPHYPPVWFCSHNDGEFHATVEEALSCPQYEEFLRQVRQSASRDSAR